jgi:5-methylcytosine-specific restriction protein A
MVELLSACITCGALIPLGTSRCPAHRETAWQNRPKANQDRYGGNWPQLVQQILRRDRWCTLRFPGCERSSTQVDHIRSVSEGGTNDPTNLRGVCKRCHARRTGQQGARASNARRRQTSVIPIRRNR